MKMCRTVLQDKGNVIDLGHRTLEAAQEYARYFTQSTTTEFHRCEIRECEEILVEVFTRPHEWEF